MTADRHIMAEKVTKGSHTPGPWHTLEGVTNGHETDSWGVVSNGQYYVATIWADVEELAASADANARLIAAAPELLQGMKDLYRAYVNLLEAGRDRITTYGGQCDSVETMERGDPWLKQARDVIAKAEGRS